MIGLHHRGVGFGEGVAWWAYGLTECRVIVKYLLLALWPHPLIFDYGLFVFPPLAQILPSAMILSLLVGVTVAALRRWPAAAFAACWFFLILAPTSSVVPVAAQPMGENRLYLPLAGVLALVVLGGFALAGRWTLAVFAIAAAGLGMAAAWQRNRVYLSESAVWSDTIAKNPSDARAHHNLGSVLLTSPGQLNAAIVQYQEALRLKPDYAEAHHNLGNAWSQLPGHASDAIAEFEEALRLRPGNAIAHYNFGCLWLDLPGHLPDAIVQFEEALRLKPKDFAEAHGQLGSAWSRIPGRTPRRVDPVSGSPATEPEPGRCTLQSGQSLAKPTRARARRHCGVPSGLAPQPDFCGSPRQSRQRLVNHARTPTGCDRPIRRGATPEAGFCRRPFQSGDRAAQNSGPRRRGENPISESVLRLQPTNATARRLLAGIRTPGP